MQRVFHKYSGAGNTFLIVDDRSQTFCLDFIPQYCDGEQVDGMILWKSSSIGDAKMEYFNRNGSYAKMCGNGLRCFAHFLNQQGFSGVRHVEVDGELFKFKGKPPNISIFLKEPTIILWETNLYDRVVYVVDTGVPHLVMFSEDFTNVQEEGKKIRNHPLFSSEGVNVNFVKIQNRSKIMIRTYERGVERETLSCGTGAIAAAFVAEKLGLINRFVTVSPLSGLSLEVELYERPLIRGPSEFLGILRRD